MTMSNLSYFGGATLRLVDRRQIGAQMRVLEKYQQTESAAWPNLCITANCQRPCDSNTAHFEMMRDLFGDNN